LDASEPSIPGGFAPNNTTRDVNGNSNTHISMGIQLDTNEVSQPSEDGTYADSEKYSIWVLGTNNNTPNSKDQIRIGRNGIPLPITINLNTVAGGDQTGIHWQKIATDWVFGKTDLNIGSNAHKHTIDIFLEQYGVQVYALAAIKNKDFDITDLSNNSPSFTNVANVKTAVSNPSRDVLLSSGFSGWGTKGFESLVELQDLHAGFDHKITAQAFDRLGNRSKVFNKVIATLELLNPIPDIKIYHPELNDENISHNGNTEIILTSEVLDVMTTKKIEDIELYVLRYGVNDVPDTLDFTLDHKEGSQVWIIKDLRMKGTPSGTGLYNYPSAGVSLSRDENYTVLVRGYDTQEKGNWTELVFGVQDPNSQGVYVNQKNYSHANGKVDFEYKYGIPSGTSGQNLIANFEVQFHERVNIGFGQKLMLERANATTTGEGADRIISGIQGGDFVAYQCDRIGKNCEVIPELQMIYGRFPLRILTKKNGIFGKCDYSSN
jgi:hypothetical protein